MGFSSSVSIFCMTQLGIHGITTETAAYLSMLGGIIGYILPSPKAKK
jgi:hypothetical protein